MQGLLSGSHTARMVLASAGYLVLVPPIPSVSDHNTWHRQWHINRNNRTRSMEEKKQNFTQYC